MSSLASAATTTATNTTTTSLAPPTTAPATVTVTGGSGGAASTASTASTARQRPNILITGTPGTGKTSTASLAAETVGLIHIDCSKLVVEKKLYHEKNEEFDSYIIDDDALCDELEEQMSIGGNIVDSHSIDYFPERWFDLVLVLRTNNTVLYDRLAKRGYNQNKLTENIQCEIMQVLLEEAREFYDLNIVHEVNSNSIDDLENNVERIQTWCQTWKPLQ
jgi:adenylate kinase